jgi:N-acetylglucosamine-6-phosphate deacetylase
MPSSNKKRPIVSLVSPEDSLVRAFVGGTSVLPDRLLENSYVEFSQGRIQKVSAIPKRIRRDIEVIDATGSYVTPGMIDIHVHGGAGADFMDGTPDAVAKACEAHLLHGVTTIFREVKHRSTP